MITSQLYSRFVLNIGHYLFFSQNNIFSWFQPCIFAKDVCKCDTNQTYLRRCIKCIFNPLSANPTKWSNTLKQFVHLFDHFVILGLKACVRYFLSIFYFFIKWYAFKNYEKCFFISSKKLFSFSRYSIFWNFFRSSRQFPDSKGQIEVE